MAKFVPLTDWTLVERDKANRQFGLIFVPKSKDRAKRITTGTVVKVGVGLTHGVRKKAREMNPALPNQRKIRPLVHPGDRVIFNVFAGHDIVTSDGAEFIAMIDAEVLALIEDESPGEARMVQAARKARTPLQTKQRYKG